MSTTDRSMSSPFVAQLLQRLGIVVQRDGAGMGDAERVERVRQAERAHRRRPCRPLDVRELRVPSARRCWWSKNA